MLRQTGAFRANQAVVDRVMDSGDLEREKGITILAKQTTVEYDGVRLNIVDTPGHADFGGEVERSAADGRLGAAAGRRSGGPAAADPLRAPEGDGPSPAGRRRDQQDRPRRRPRRPRSSTRSTSCSSTSAPTSTRSSSRSSTRTPRLGTATRDLAEPGHGPPAAPRPARRGHAAADLRARTTRSSCWSPTCRPTTTSGRMAVGRIWNGTMRMGQRITVVREEADDTDGAVEPGRTVTLTGTVTSLQTAHGHRARRHRRGRPGRDRRRRRPARGDDRRHDHRPGRPAAAAAPRRRRADAAMTFGVNTSPLAGRDGQVRDQPPDQGPPGARGAGQRLDRGPPDRVRRHVRGPRPGRAPAGRPDRADAARGLRAHGRRARRSSCATVDGETQEPYERITIDIPPDYIGEVQQALAGRKGRLEQMSTDADGRVRMEFVLPVRGLIGYRGQLLTDTRGTALLHQIGEGYGPWAGEVTHRTNGVLVSDRAGHVERLWAVQPPGALELFIGAGEEVYEGMIVGENAALGRHGRQPDEGEEAHEHPDPLPRRGAAADAAAAADPRVGDRVHRQRRAGRGDAHGDPPAQARCSPSTSANGAGPGVDQARSAERASRRSRGGARRPSPGRRSADS